MGNTPMLTHPLLRERPRANDAVHEDSGVSDGQSGCTCGFWISDSWAGAEEGRIRHPRRAKGYKYAYHLAETYLKLMGCTEEGQRARAFGANSAKLLGITG